MNTEHVLDARQAAARHTPVLLERCLDLLSPALERDGAVMVDATVGMGGHAESVLRRFGTARVIGIDRDRQAVALASDRLAGYGDRFTAVHACYDEITDVLAAAAPGRSTVDAVLMDLGVSSLQLDEPERGFSYAHDAPLDMRMDPDGPLTAAQVLATYDQQALARVLAEYGEERFARRIAQRIVATRPATPLTRTYQLVDLVRAAIPAAARTTGGHPAKRTFQALRIEVNDELGALERALPLAVEHLAVGGRIVVESYHSLEDRLVKRTFAAAATSSAPRGLPVEPAGTAAYMRLVTHGAERADEAEVAANPRSASVRLRAAERTAPTPAGRRGGVS
ncbi:MAG: 16S rRNA (cytosine(1402)-N(4))-methyltransferase RsmH [Micrococcales bacterium]|nr:16S rRNA (cytosine(1402)-N(4))-methyltransferase RsmH [Micrococcales bacterium]MCL2667359.1 16S rRNA (cytosine(1402)-N(4))-methyltransferase RsmH [Micrococcales bacterium]